MVTVEDVWPLFAMTAVVTTTASNAGGNSDGVTATTRVTVPAMPWSQLLVVGFAVALVAVALWDRRRRRRHWAAMVEQAREQGRRDAATGVWILGIAVLVAFGAFAVVPSPAHASEPVGVTVDISPHAEPTVTPERPAHVAAPAPSTPPSAHSGCRAANMLDRTVTDAKSGRARSFHFVDASGSRRMNATTAATVRNVAIGNRIFGTNARSAAFGAKIAPAAPAAKAAATAA